MRPGHRALRRGRVSLPNQAYLVTTVTAGRLPVFADLYAGRRVVREMRRLHMAGTVESLAFVVMHDHLHWLFTLPDGARLSRVVQLLKGRSARNLGAAIWQRGYHDHAIRKDEDLQATARYIVANPLRAGLVERIGDYALWDTIWLDAALYP
ncbi:MAG: transposase [Gammaproteobacteria bacterium]|nr:transposase [Gammaproteobacteria bacterium]